MLSISMSPTKPEEVQDMRSIIQRETVGTILWLFLGTRPDICYVVYQVAKSIVWYDSEDWKAVTRIFRYFNCTKQLGIKLMAMNNSSDYI